MVIDNSLYAVLGVAPDATPEAIDAAYRQREAQLQAEPDDLSLLRVAYDTLRHPARRAGYDRHLARQTKDAAPPPELLLTTEPAWPRTRMRNWLALLLAASGTIAWFWLQKPPPAKPRSAPLPAAAAVTTPPPRESAPAGEAAAEASPPAVAVAADAPAPTAVTAATAATAASEAPAAPAAVLLQRGPRPAGFDAQYVAWSVFTIRQRKLSGSGVMIGPDRILTNCHVLAGGATNGLVVIHAVSGQVTRVEKYARLDGEDACLLFAPGAGNDSIEWGNSATLRAGDTVHALGHPGGSVDVIWSDGPFRMRIDRGGETFLLSDTYCRPGSSGGPLLDNEGRLVGIVTAVQRFKAKGGDPQYGACVSVTEATARALLSKPLFPIALAPAQYVPNY